MTLALASFLLVASLAAQGTAAGATVTGTVQDEQGGAITNARVEITCGSDRHQTMSDVRGQFTLGGLPGGRCSGPGAARARRRPGP